MITDVSLRIERGQVAGLIGPNGSGKSTLLKAIAGVLPLRSGSILLDGDHLRPSAGLLAFVPQREEVKWDFPVTAQDVVLMGRTRAIGWLRGAGDADRAIADAALDRFGLGGQGGRHISQFSGGQQQRIFFARVLAQEPAIVLLDEVFTGVDAINRAIFREAIRDFAAAGAVVLLATHDFDEMQSVCDTVGFVDRGLVAYGPVGTTFTADRIRQTFGGQVVVLS